MIQMQQPNQSLHLLINIYTMSHKKTPTFLTRLLHLLYQWKQDPTAIEQLQNLQLCPNCVSALKPHKTGGVQKPTKMSDIGFLKSKLSQTDLKFKNRKLKFLQFGLKN